MHGGRLVLVPVVAIRTVSNMDVAPEPPMDKVRAGTAQEGGLGHGFMGVS